MGELLWQAFRRSYRRVGARQRGGGRGRQRDRWSAVSGSHYSFVSAGVASAGRRTRRSTHPRITGASYEHSSGVLLSREQDLPEHLQRLVGANGWRAGLGGVED